MLTPISYVYSLNELGIDEVLIPFQPTFPTESNLEVNCIVV